jgi:hypothetical protein
MTNSASRSSARSSGRASARRMAHVHARASRMPSEACSALPRRTYDGNTVLPQPQAQRGERRGAILGMHAPQGGARSQARRLWPLCKETPAASAPIERAPRRRRSSRRRAEPWLRASPPRMDAPARDEHTDVCFWRRGPRESGMPTPYPSSLSACSSSSSVSCSHCTTDQIHHLRKRDALDRERGEGERPATVAELKAHVVISDAMLPVCGPSTLRHCNKRLVGLYTQAEEKCGKW